MNKIRNIIAIILLTFSFAANANELVMESGNLCIGPIPKPEEVPNAWNIKLQMKTTFEYSVQVDDKEIVKLPFHENVTYEKLALGQKHLIKIYYEGNIVESFWFTFEERNTNSLCLWFKSQYETWQLWNQEGNRLCACNK